MSELRIQTFSVSTKARIAEGGFGFVDLVHDSRSRKDFALKRCGVQQSEQLEIVKKEVSVLTKFVGPYLVKLHAYEIVTTNGKAEARLLLEYCNGGTMLNLLQSRKDQALPEQDIFRFFGQVLLALKPLHEDPNPVTHRDIKLENILFGSDRNIRLCDFGSCVFGPVYIDSTAARAAEEEKIAKETTQMYRSPELVDIHMRDVLTTSSDVWAMGCVLYTLCFLKHPFQDAGSLGILNENINIPTSKSISEGTRTLIARMLDFDAEARPTIAQVLEGVTALAQNQPLPPYSLTQEAIQIKQLRIQRAAEKKTQKHKKNTYSSQQLPARKTQVPLTPDSVAAKRLAAKKGIGVGIGMAGIVVPEQSPTVGQQTHSNNSYSSNSSNSDLLNAKSNSFAVQPADEFVAKSGASGTAEVSFSTNFDMQWSPQQIPSSINSEKFNSFSPPPPSSSKANSSINAGATDDPFVNFAATANVDFGGFTSPNPTTSNNTNKNSNFSNYDSQGFSSAFTSFGDGFSSFSKNDSSSTPATIDAFDITAISSFDFGTASSSNFRNSNSNSNSNNNSNNNSSNNKNGGNNSNTSNNSNFSNSFTPPPFTAATTTTTAATTTTTTAATTTTTTAATTNTATTATTTASTTTTATTTTISNNNNVIKNPFESNNNSRNRSNSSSNSNNSNSNINSNSSEATLDPFSAIDNKIATSNSVSTTPVASTNPIDSSSSFLTSPPPPYVSPAIKAIEQLVINSSPSPSYNYPQLDSSALIIINKIDLTVAYEINGRKIVERISKDALLQAQTLLINSNRNANLVNLSSLSPNSSITAAATTTTSSSSPTPVPASSNLRRSSIGFGNGNAMIPNINAFSTTKTTTPNSNINFPINGRNNNFGAYNINSSTIGGGNAIGGGGGFNTVTSNRRTSIQGTFDPFEGLGQKM